MAMSESWKNASGPSGSYSNGGPRPASKSVGPAVLKKDACWECVGESSGTAWWWRD